MAIVAEDLTSIALLIAEIPNYTGFNNALRADILKNKMARKYTNILTQYASNNIDTPAHFIVWLRYKYQTETVGTQQIATQRLAQEKFLPFDNPETYEARICSLLLGVADANANILELLKGHLSGELYIWMKIANPAGFNAFFTELKNIKSSKFVSVQAPSLPSKPQIKKNITSNSDSVDEITKGMADMVFNIAKIAKNSNVVAKTVKKSQRYCSNCSRIGHNSHSDLDTSSNDSDSDSNSVSGSSSEDSSSESESLNVNISRSKKKVKQKRKSNKLSSYRKKSIKSKKKNKKEKKPNSNSKKNSAIQDSKNNSQKNNNFINYREPIPGIPESDEEKETLNDPMEIDFVQKKEPATDVKIAERLKLDIDTREKHVLLPFLLNYLELTKGTTLKALVSNQISQKVKSNESDNELLEKWHAPTGFSLDTDNSTLAEQVPKVLKINA
ncbi:hypothetical protein C2G38_2208789 [Gigaspora rosea]|uniref:Uncharacterized protein n=1 Tax=Gigaspora rosea TaxID=44941 RepID=A0A397UGS2_9GLOM|nr:hypothetical protein C2G38_2208789 [Gigaspora rosea]